MQWFRARLPLSLFPFFFCLAGCGGGSSADAPPPIGTKLEVTLADAGSLPFEFESTTPSGFRLMETSDQYIEFASGLGPYELRNIDYARFSVLYLEGPALDYLASVVRLVDIRRFDGTRDMVTAERCTPDVNAVPTPSRAFRPYSYYVVPKLLSSKTFAWVNAAPPACATVSASGATFVAEGQWNYGSGTPLPASPNEAIRSQAELDAVLPFFAPGTIPAQYLAPDFGQVTLLFVSQSIFDSNAYIRIDRVLVDEDGTRDVIAEFCGYFYAHQAFASTVALYAVPRFADQVRFTVIRHLPGSCFLAR